MSIVLQRRIARLEHDIAARRAGILETALEDSWNRNGDSIRVDETGKVDTAGALNLDDFFALRKTDSTAHFYGRSDAATAPAPGKLSPEEVAKMSPSEKMRAGTMAKKPKGY